MFLQKIVNLFKDFLSRKDPFRNRVYLNWVGSYQNLSWDLERSCNSVLSHSNLSLDTYSNLERLSGLAASWTDSQACDTDECDIAILKDDPYINHQLGNMFLSDKDKFRHDTELYLLLTRLFRDSYDSIGSDKTTSTEVAILILAKSYPPENLRPKDFNLPLSFGFLDPNGYSSESSNDILVRDIKRLYRYVYHCAETEAPLGVLILLNALGCALTLRYKLRNVLFLGEFEQVNICLSHLLKTLTEGMK